MLSTAQPNINIRDITSITEMRDVEDLQKQVWGCSDRDIVPALTLKPSVEVGGILVGAFDSDSLIGFAYGFVGLEGNQAIIHSDMLAVKPEYRNLNIGYQLKLAQRERAIARGITIMTWTFDPLQSRNAHLNFRKLGVVSAGYKINYYGEETSSFLHRNIGTDRLWVHWPLMGERVRRRLESKEESLPILKEVTPLVRIWADGSPETSELNKDCVQKQFMVEIPSDIGSLQQQNPALAMKWREAIRIAFSEAMAAGFLAEEFYRLTRDGQAYGAYLLSYGKRVEDFMN